MLQSKDKKIKWTGIILLGASILFYLAFYIIDGVMLCSDSASYIDMSISREPVYPFFLALHRFLFGNENYLIFVVITQCILAGYAMWKLADLVFQYAKSKVLLPAAAIVFQMAVALICRFIAERKAIYANEIASEGLTFAMYTLFIVQLFYYLKESKTRNLVGVLVYAVILVGTRKQMLFSFAVLFAVFTMRILFRKYTWKKYAILMGFVVLAFMSTKVVESVYNFSLRGEWTTRKRDSAFFLVTALYVGDNEDVEKFNDIETRKLYGKMIAEVRKQKLGFEDAQNDWRSRSLHYANSYDAIGYGIAYPMITEYVAVNHPSDEVGEAIKFDYFGNDLTKTLVADNIGKMINVILSNAVMGFVNTVANVKGIFGIYSFVIYVVFLLLIGWMLYKKKYEEELLMAEITLFSILANVACVALTIFSQPRYMIYNMPLFYLSLAWMGYYILEKFMPKIGQKVRKDG